MAGVDTSSYPTAASIAAAQQANNPLTMLSGLAELRGRALQNQLTQRTMSAQQAVGQAAQGAMGDDGQIDTGKFISAVKNDPNAAYGAVDAANQAMAYQTQQVALAMKQYDLINNSLGALADQPGVTAKQITSSVGDMVAQGLISPKVAAGELAGMPTDPTQLPTWLRQTQLKAQAAAQQVADYHAQTMVNNGQQMMPVNTAPLAEPPAPIQMQMSPGEAASPVAGPVDASGAPTTTTLGQRAGMGTIATGLSPAQAAAQQTGGAGTAQQALAFEQAARGAKDMSAALANMSGDLSKLPTTGPGSERRNSFMAAINGFMGTGFDAEKIASQEGFGKMAAQVVARQRQQMGLSGTDQQLSMIEHASPGSQLSKMGNEQQIAVIKGNNAALQAEGDAWQRYQQSGKGKENFNQFTTTWNKHVDPLAFQWQYMSPAQKQALTSAMSKDEQEKFAQSLTFARANKLVP